MLLTGPPSEPSESSCDLLADQLVAMARLDGVGPGTIHRLAERYLDEDVAARVTGRLDQLGLKP